MDYDDDSASGSLEDLVNSFDSKLTAVFQNYQEQVDKIAPVQVRRNILPDAKGHFEEYKLARAALVVRWLVWENGFLSLYKRVSGARGVTAFQRL
jgi:hypothetical protein